MLIVALIQDLSMKGEGSIEKYQCPASVSNEKKFNSAEKPWTIFNDYTETGLKVFFKQLKGIGG